MFDRRPLVVCLILFGFLGGCILPSNSTRRIRPPRPKAPPGYVVVLLPGPSGGSWALLKTDQPAKAPAHSDLEKDEEEESSAEPHSMENEVLAGPDASDLEAVERAFLDSINDLRSNEGIPPLQPHPSIAMNTSEFCAENRPMEAGVSPKTQIDGQSLCLFNTLMMEEKNNTPDAIAEALLAAWLDNEKSRGAILDAGFQFTGFEVTVQDETLHVIQLLRRQVSE